MLFSFLIHHQKTFIKWLTRGALVMYFSHQNFYFSYRKIISFLSQKNPIGMLRYFFANQIFTRKNKFLVASLLFYCCFYFENRTVHHKTFNLSFSYHLLSYLSTKNHIFILKDNHSFIILSFYFNALLNLSFINFSTNLSSQKILLHVFY